MELAYSAIDRLPSFSAASGAPAAAANVVIAAKIPK
jgi:hypothetical protein